MEGLIPKPEKKAPKWKNNLFYLSILMLIITIGSYAGFVHFLDEANRLIQAKNIEIQEIGSPEQKISNEKVLKYERKINDFLNLTNNYQYASNFLKFLETSVINGVVLTNMSLDVLESKAELTGNADSFQILGQQQDFFKNSGMLAKTNLISTAINKEGKVSFIFDLSINPEMFQKQE